MSSRTFVTVFVATATVAAAYYWFQQQQQQQKLKEEQESYDNDAGAPSAYAKAEAETEAEPDSDPTVLTYADKDEVSKELCAFVVEAARESIEGRGVFHLAVAGGSLLDALKGLVPHKDEIDFSKVVLSFANHKCVAPESDSATMAKCRSKFATAVGITTIVSPSPTPREGGDGSEEAAYYATQLQNRVPHSSEGYPIFDLVLLGLGADGHVGSCHPLGAAVSNTTDAVAGSPKDGEPSSITLTIESMNASRRIGVVVCGGSKGKKEAVKRATTRPPEAPRGTFPAQLLQSPTFFLDTEAAADL